MYQDYFRITSDWLILKKKEVKNSKKKLLHRKLLYMTALLLDIVATHFQAFVALWHQLLQSFVKDLHRQGLPASSFDALRSQNL